MQSHSLNSWSDILVKLENQSLGSYKDALTSKGIEAKIGW